MGKVYNFFDKTYAEISKDPDFVENNVYIVVAPVPKSGNTLYSTSYAYWFLTTTKLEADIVPDFLLELNNYEESCGFKDYVGAGYSGKSASLGLHMVGKYVSSPGLIESITFYKISSADTLTMLDEEFTQLFFEQKRKREEKSERYKQYLELRKEFEGK